MNVMLTLSLFFVVVFAAILYLIKTILVTELTVNLSVAFLACLAAYVATRGIAIFIPREKISSDNKAVFITGCDTGFGNELAKNLDALGFHVYAGCLFPDKKGASELKENCSERLRVLQLDVTNDELVKAAAKEVESTLDGKELWAVVNNAGIAGVGEIEWCSIETYQKIIDVNTLGPIRVTKSFLPMLRKSCGRVVIVASLAGRFTFPGLSAYSMSKHATVSFADAFRREMKNWNITVHTVEPSLYKTPISALETLLSGLKTTWDSMPTEIQKSYGLKYFRTFQRGIIKNMKRENENISEVIDDLVDAVAGRNPKMIYYPGIKLQITVRMLSMLPTELQDYLVNLVGQPRCIPADRQSSAELTQSHVMDNIIISLIDLF